MPRQARIAYNSSPRSVTCGGFGAGRRSGAPEFVFPRVTGLSVSDAIRLLMLRIADEHRLPFEIKAPNASLPPTTVTAPPRYRG